MVKKGIVLVLISIGFWGFISANNIAVSSKNQRKNFNSCNQIGKILFESKPVSNLSPSFKAEDIPQLVPITFNQDIFEDFIVLHQEKNNQIVLIKSPKSSKDAVINIQSPRVFASIKFSSKFSKIHFFRYENLLIIFSQYDQKSLVLIYQVEEKTVIPVKYFQIDGNLLDTRLISNRLYFATQRNISPWEISRYKQGTLKIENIIPHFSEGKVFAANQTGTKELDCRIIQHSARTSSSENNQFVNVMLMDLKALAKGTHISSFFGKLEDIKIQDKFLYISYPDRDPDLNVTFFDQFTLEPTANYMYSYQFTGSSSNENFFKNFSQFAVSPIFQPFGGLNAQIVPIESEFLVFSSHLLNPKLASTYYFNGNINYLSSKGQIEFFWKENNTITSLGMVKTETGDQLRYPYGQERGILKFMTIHTKEDRLYFRLIKVEIPTLLECQKVSCREKELDKQLIKSGFYSGRLGFSLSEIADLGFFDVSKKIFYFPLKLFNPQNGQLVFNGIKSLSIPSAALEPFQEILSRDYKSHLGSMGIRTFQDGKIFTVVSGPRFFDIFVTDSPEKSKSVAY